MIRSAKPSPLTSPAEATERPVRSYAAAPLSVKPLLPSRLDRSIFAGDCAMACCLSRRRRSLASLPCVHDGRPYRTSRRSRQLWVYAHFLRKRRPTATRLARIAPPDLALGPPLRDRLN